MADQSTKEARMVIKSSVLRLKPPLAMMVEKENRIEINNNSTVKKSIGKYVLNLFLKTLGASGMSTGTKGAKIEKYFYVLPRINLLMFS